MSRGIEPDLQRAHGLVGDLFDRRRWIYWLDLTLTLSAVGMMCWIGGRAISWWSAVLLVPVSILVFRAGAQIHEIQHLRVGEFPSFRVVWNVVCGCPLGIPDPMFDYHGEHHSVSTFGTDRDPEYLDLPRPLPSAAYWGLVRDALRVPLLGHLRFTVGTASLVIRPDVRDRFERRLSEFHFDPWNPMEPWAPERRRRWIPFEVVALLQRLLLVALLIAGIVPMWLAVYLYLAQAGAMFINRLRFLLQHRYQVSGPRSFAEQVADSWDYPTPTAFLWSPTGLAYHAMHHWFPRMPYHALGRAHRRLARDPQFSGFVRSVSGPPGLRRALVRLSEPRDQDGGFWPVSPE